MANKPNRVHYSDLNSQRKSQSSRHSLSFNSRTQNTKAGPTTTFYALRSSETFSQRSSVALDNINSTMAVLDKYRVKPQMINAIRYQMNRFDVARAEQIPSKQFRDLFKHFNIRMIHRDLNVLLEYLQLKRPGDSSLGSNFNTITRNNQRVASEDEYGNPLTENENESGNQNNRVIYDLRQLSKLCDTIARQQFGILMEKNAYRSQKAKENRDIQMLSSAMVPNTSLEVMLDTLQQKLRINFKDPNDAYRFFDMFSNQRCRKDHFVYCCMFLAKGLDFMELLELFSILDTKGDGTLDEQEFVQIFNGVEDSWNSHHHNIMKSILRDQKAI